MKYIFSFFSILLLISCDPGYSYIINNNSEKDIYVFTKPNYKKIYYHPKLDSVSYDSILIKSKENFIIYSHIGWGGNEESFPYHIILVKKEKDSILLKNKSEINTEFNLNRKWRVFHNTYSWNIK